MITAGNPPDDAADFTAEHSAGNPTDDAADFAAGRPAGNRADDAADTPAEDPIGGAAEPGGSARSRPLALRPVPPLHGIPAKRCPDGHPNDPEAVTCRLCDHPIDVAVSVVDLQPGPLGRLLLEDGTATALVADLTVGRCPPDDEAPDTLVVVGRQVSRVHFAVEVRGWRLGVRDRGSTNGTFITRRGERGRRRVPEDRSVPLAIGDAIHFGARQALVVRPD